MKINNHEIFIRKCYQLAISAGKKGFDSFGAIVVSDNRIIEEAENTADYAKGLFGHAEFNVVHKCANKYHTSVLENAILYSSCAPCVHCLMAIASLGIKHIVYGVSYQSFGLLLPFETETIDYESLFKQMGIDLITEGPILED